MGKLNGVTRIRTTGLQDTHRIVRVSIEDQLSSTPVEGGLLTRGTAGKILSWQVLQSGRYPSLYSIQQLRQKESSPYGNSFVVTAPDWLLY